MRKIYALLFCLSLGTVSQAQPWPYDFGTSTGTFNSSTASESFLPTPATNGGKARVRTGTGSTGFVLEPSTIGTTGSQLRIKASSGTSTTKFSMYDFTPGKTFAMKFKMNLSGATSGSWFFMIGDGANFSNSDPSNQGGTAYTATFFAMKMAFGASSAITTTIKTSANTYSGTGITGTPFTQSATYEVEILGNNTTALVSYTRNGVSYDIAANKVDVWVDDVLVADDIAKSSDFANNTNVDSWMFIGESGASAQIILDDIEYTSNFTTSPLPIQLISFDARKLAEQVQLNWATASELNNESFTIERSANGKEFEAIGTIAGAGTSHSILKYRFTDEKPAKGINYYQLRQKDFNGESSLSKVVAVSSDSKSLEIIQVQNAGQSLKMEIISPVNAETDILVYDLAGKTIAKQNVQLTEGFNTIELATEQTVTGIHLIKLMNSETTVSKKFLF
jgi:hypothetical protein